MSCNSLSPTRCRITIEENWVESFSFLKRPSEDRFSKSLMAHHIRGFLFNSIMWNLNILQLANKLPLCVWPTPYNCPLARPTHNTSSPLLTSSYYNRPPCHHVRYATTDNNMSITSNSALYYGNLWVVVGDVFGASLFWSLQEEKKLGRPVCVIQERRLQICPSIVSFNRFDCQCHSSWCEAVICLRFTFFDHILYEVVFEKCPLTAQQCNQQPSCAYVGTITGWRPEFAWKSMDWMDVRLEDLLSFA